MQFVAALLGNTWSLLRQVSCWVVVSFLLAGILHNVLCPEIWQRNLGNCKFSSLIKATISGALLPVCSCGVVPLGLSLYYSGAYLGNVLAFIIATPVINPAAVLIALTTLGPQLTLTYVSAGLCIPIIVGAIANRLGGPELISPLAPSAPARESTPTELSLTMPHPPLHQRLLAGLRWGVADLGKEVSQYLVPGALLAAFILTVIPVSFIQAYLSRPDMVSIIGVAALGAVMYVCAVGHIPFVAALIGAGAAPGIAITFILTGAASNLPELISLYRLMGKRTVLIYVPTLVLLAALWGYMTNLLLPNYVPLFDVSATQGTLAWGNRMSISFPAWLEVICATALIFFCLWGRYPKVKQFLLKPKRA